MILGGKYEICQFWHFCISVFVLCIRILYSDVLSLLLTYTANTLTAPAAADDDDDAIHGQQTMLWRFSLKVFADVILGRKCKSCNSESWLLLSLFWRSS